MGRYALILVVSLVILLSYFVIHSNQRKVEATLHNVEELSFVQAKNIANSAAQLVVRNIIRPDLSGWKNFKSDSYAVGSILGEIPFAWRNPNRNMNWPDMDGSFRVTQLDNSRPMPKVSTICYSLSRVGKTLLTGHKMQG